MPNKLVITDPTKILTLANIISLGRALLAVPIIYTLRDPSLGTFTFLLILLATLSDALDGWVARKAREVTHFGKWIDPIADFACILSVSSYLTLVGRFPGWFFILYLSRYITIALTAIYFLNTTNGPSVFENNKKVDCVENRIVIFPTKVLHAGSTHTDSQVRGVINFNWF